MEDNIYEILVGGGGTGGGGGDDIEGARGGGVVGEAQVPAAYICNNIPQEKEVRFMELDSEGNLYTISGTDTVHKWYRGLTVQASWSTSKPINAFFVGRSDRCTDALFAHDKGRIDIWRWYHSEHPSFRSLGPQLIVPDSIPNLFSFMKDLRKYTISCLCLSDDHNFIYAGAKNNIVYVWQRNDLTGGLFDSIRGHAGEVLSLAVGPGVVFTGSADGGVRVWKREQYGPNRYARRHRLLGTFLIIDRIPMRVNALVFKKYNENSGWLYAGSFDRKVRCWKNLQLNETLGTWPAPEVMISHKGAITCLTLCSGPFVFSGSNDKKICVWRRGDGDRNHTLEAVLTGHENPINCMAAQLDDGTENDAQAPRRWILYSGSFEALRIWRVNEEPLALHQ